MSTRTNCDLITETTATVAWDMFDHTSSVLYMLTRPDASLTRLFEENSSSVQDMEVALARVCQCS